MPAAFFLMYAGRCIRSSGSTGSFTLPFKQVRDTRRVNRKEKFTFTRYDRDAIMLDTNGLRDNPYCAAPLSVAVSVSGGRPMNGIRCPNWS